MKQNLVKKKLEIAENDGEITLLDYESLQAEGTRPRTKRDLRRQPILVV